MVNPMAGIGEITEWLDCPSKPEEGEEDTMQDVGIEESHPKGKESNVGRPLVLSHREYLRADGTFANCHDNRYVNIVGIELWMTKLAYEGMEYECGPYPSSPPT